MNNNKRLSDLLNNTTFHSKWNKKGNIKLGSIWSYSTLMGDDEIMIDKLGVAVCGTCGGHCAACKNSCYVKKSYRYSSVKLGHARNTLALMQDPARVGAELSGYITRAKNKPAACRLDQSGEITGDEHFNAFCSLAADHPKIPFFCYTKNYAVVIPALLAGLVPENLTILISVWHEYGIREYNRVKHLDNVKAFVYDDGAFDYAAAGLDITTWCKAYDDKGKLDHEITCQRCRKCYNRAAVSKVIGCKAH